MEIKKELPPVWDKASKVFRLTGREIFAYHPYVYNPSGEPLTKALKAHEQVHLDQQRGHPAEWWDCYLADAKFRLEMELEAHIVEYKVFCGLMPNPDRRKNYLKQIARRISLPMYGEMITYTQAKKRIENG